MNQRARVLRALKRYPQGICQGDFDAPNVIDGGPRISRVAARIKDLRNDGHEIVVDGERWGYALYKLPQAEPVPIPPPEFPVLEPPADEHLTDPLFTLPEKPRPFEEAA